MLSNFFTRSDNTGCARQLFALVYEASSAALDGIDEVDDCANKKY